MIKIQSFLSKYYFFYNYYIHFLFFYIIEIPRQHLSDEKKTNRAQAISESNSRGLGAIYFGNSVLNLLGIDIDNANIV